jgi:hypothetical protein
MSFLRHGEIYPCDEGAISRPRPRSSPWMSLQLVIPGRLLSSRARFRFTSRSYTANHQPRPTMLRQRTAQCRLTDCLSPGVHSRFRIELLCRASFDTQTLPVEEIADHASVTRAKS